MHSREAAETKIRRRAFTNTGGWNTGHTERDPIPTTTGFQNGKSTFSFPQRREFESRLREKSRCFWLLAEPDVWPAALQDSCHFMSHLQPQASAAKRRKRRDNDGRRRKEGKTESRAIRMKEEMKKLRSNNTNERKRDNKPEQSAP